jgi:hypothetical protein
MDIHPDWSPRLKFVKHIKQPIARPIRTALKVNSGCESEIRGRHGLMKLKYNECGISRKQLNVTCLNQFLKFIVGENRASLWILASCRRVVCPSYLVIHT